MPKINLTDAFVSGVSVTTRTEFWDTARHSSVVLRVTPNGVKSWSVVYRRPGDAKKTRLTLGNYPALSLARAREKARKALEALADGVDPANDKRELREGMTVEELGKKFIAEYAKPRKKSWREDERLLTSDVYPKLGATKIKALTRRTILDLVQAKATGSPVAADRVLAVTRKMLAWATDDLELLDSNPAADIPARSTSKPRERVLTDDELAETWRRVAGDDVDDQPRDIVRLLILTGQRSGEVCGMLAGEVRIGDAEWHIPASRTKNGRPHIVPLSGSALAILRPRISGLDTRAPVFSRGTEPMDPRYIAKVVRSLRGADLADDAWTPHDIRRTVATGMARLKVSPHIIESVLNHVSGFRSGVAGIYNRHAYLTEKRQALVKWDKWVVSLTFKNDANVTAINRA